MAPEATSDVTLRIERIYPFPPERIFDAWTTPESLKQWFAPSPQFTTIVHEMEPRVGGRYRIEMRSPDGNPHIAFGTFEVVDRPHRLVFSWSWEQTNDAQGSRVTLQLDRDGSGTRLVLVHERLATAAQRESHAKGWNGILEQLAGLR